MDTVELAIINLKETRRRSIKLWHSLPDEWLSWKPDVNAFSFGEMIRHVWTSWVESLKPEDLTNREIVRTDTDIVQRSSLDAYIMLAANHDATHTGQFLQYMRMVGIERPNIWD